MRKAIVFMFALFLSLGVSAACTSDRCSPTEEQCACLSEFKTSNTSGGPETTNFNAGEIIYIDFTVENIGTMKLENMKFFYIISNNWAHADGAYSTMMVSGVDIDPGDSVSYTNAQVPLRSHIPPGDYTLRLYVSTESNQYLQIPTKTITVANTGPWVGTVLSSKVRKSGETTWVNIANISVGDSFDYKVTIENPNTISQIEANLIVRTSIIESCDTADPVFGVPSGTNADITIPAGSTVEYFLSGCELKPAYETGRQSLSTYTHTVDGYRLREFWPKVIIDVPNVSYYNIWADKDYLAQGETTTISAEFAITNADLPPDSKIVFSIIDNANGIPIADRENIFTAGLATGSHVESVAVNDYSNPTLSNDFTVTVSVRYPDDSEVTKIWGTQTKRFSAPSPHETIDLDSYPGGPETVSFTFSTGQKTILLTGSSNSVTGISVSGVSQYVMQPVSGGVELYVWPLSGSDTVVSFTVVAASASAPSLGFIDSLIVLALCSLALFFFLRKSLK